MDYRLIYSKTSREQIRSLHPRLKMTVKRKLDELKENPFSGKPLEKELSGYYSLRGKRFRVIYKVVQKNKAVQIHYVGHRKDVYEILKESRGKGSSRI